MAKTARTIARKNPSPARTARRPASKAAPKKSKAKRKVAAGAPQLSRIVRNVELIAPPGCIASLVLKQVAYDAYRYYAPWLLVGRYDVDALPVKYKFTGENTIRCDIPEDGEVSLAALQPPLVAFLEAEGKEPDGPPVVIGRGRP